MTIEKSNIIYELEDNGAKKTAKIIKCLSNKARITIPKEIVIPTTNEIYKVIGVSAGSFKDCENLESIMFESQVDIEYIGAGAFENCISLKSFSVPEKIKCIESRCFYNCISLRYIKSENQLSRIKKIGKSAFENCNNLKTIKNLNLENIETISKEAFKNCYKLSASLENSIASINRSSLSIIICAIFAFLWHLISWVINIISVIFTPIVWIANKIKGLKQLIVLKLTLILDKIAQRITPRTTTHSDRLKKIGNEAFENCKDVVITGRALNYYSGEHYDTINPSKARNRTWKPLKIYHFGLIVALIVSLLIFCFLRINDGVIITLFLIFAFLAITCFNYFLHKKAIFELSLGFVFLTLSTLLIFTEIGSIFSTQGFIYKEISIKDSVIENVQIDNTELVSDIKIQEVNSKSTIKGLVDPLITEEQVVEKNIIYYKGETSVQVFNYQNSKLIDNIRIRFDDEKKKVRISLEAKEGITLFYKLDGKETTYEASATDDNNKQFEITIDKCNSISLSTTDNQEGKVDLYLISFEKIDEQSFSQTIIILEIVIFALVVIFATFATIIFIYFLGQMQSNIERNKTLIIVVCIIAYIVIELISKKSVPEILHDSITAGFGL